MGENPALVIFPSGDVFPEPLDNDFWTFPVRIMAMARTEFLTRWKLLTVLAERHGDLTSFA